MLPNRGMPEFACPVMKDPNPIKGWSSDRRLVTKELHLWVVGKGRAGVQDGVIVQQLDISGLQPCRHCQLRARCQLIKQLDGVLLSLCETRHLHRCKYYRFSISRALERFEPLNQVVQHIQYQNLTTCTWP